jgi:hypothetical protein
LFYPFVLYSTSLLYPGKNRTKKPDNPDPSIVSAKSKKPYTKNEKNFAPYPINKERGCARETRISSYQGADRLQARIPSHELFLEHPSRTHRIKSVLKGFFMPVKSGQDTKGPFFQWGSQAKYYYRAGDKVSRKRAIAKAYAQQSAIEYSLKRKGRSLPK